MYKILFLLYLCVLHCFCAGEEKFVKISLDAKWKQTPIVLEASEFLAEKSNVKFWNFVEGFDVPALATDKVLYDLIFEKSELSNTEHDVLTFSLSIRSFSPRVQLHKQTALNLQKDCPIFFQTSKYIFSCDLEEALQNAKPNKDLVEPFDHVYPGSENNEKVLVVYANFITQEFRQLHPRLVELSKSTQYVLRHNFKSSGDEKVALSGYGVELAVKSTEYKNVDDQKVEDEKKDQLHDGNEEGGDEIEGFLFNKLRDLHPDLKEQLSKFKQHLKDRNKELSNLHQWEVQDLSFQAAQRVMSASSQDQLKLLKDLSQNVPMLARSLVQTNVNNDLREEIKLNQRSFEMNNLAPGDAAFFVNGIQQEAQQLNIFKLDELLRSEGASLAELNKLNLDSGKLGKLLALSVVPEQESFVIDTRSESIQWMNDLEQDSQYQYWPSQLRELLRPTFPGMLRYIAKNVFHVVAFVDPTTVEGVNIIVEMTKLVEQSIPARFGILFVSNGKATDKAEEDASVGILRAFSFIKSDKSVKDAFSWLNALYRSCAYKKVEAQDVIHLLRSWYDKDDAEEALAPSSDYDDLRKTSKKFYDKVGVRKLPQIMVNGENVDFDQAEDLENVISNKILHLTPDIQQAVYMGTHHGHPTIYDYVMSQDNVVPRVNSLIQTTKGKYASFSNQEVEEDINKINEEQAFRHLMKKANYFIQDHGAVTIWVIADATTTNGRKLIKNALKFVQNQKNTRLAVFLHGESSAERNLNDVFTTLFDLRKNLISGVAKMAVKLIENSQDLTQEAINKLADKITGINKKKLFGLLSSSEELERTRKLILGNSALLKKSLLLKQGESYVVANSRVIGPLPESDVFVVEDFNLLQSFENNRGGFKVLENVENINLENLPSEGRDRYKSDLAMQIMAVLSTREDRKRVELRHHSEKVSVIHKPPREAGVAFSIRVVIDPLSKDAQKLIPIVMVLHESLNVDLKIFMNCKAQHSELPVNRFYQYVLNAKLAFDEQGRLLNDQAAVFTGLPHSVLLTTIMDTPHSWLIEAVGSNQDLDNIHLQEANRYVYGDFDLEYILVEGHCSDESNQPPRGLQFILGTEREPDQFDTIVMANFGYFQLKAYPGAFVLQLRDGRSSQIYQIDSVTGATERSAGQNYTLFIDSFTGKFLKTKVKRREGEEKSDLLSEDGEEEEDDFGIWRSIASYVKSETKSTKNTDGKIHIFSVATGLLYERFLRIMMLSVLKHTQTPVKFWFLKNFLSSGFTKFLPQYAEKYGFEYELVQYQWPTWLNAQTEKQRIIWGYKILFLDVLFPLNLERIIFVDADQIVRADLKELMDMDLDGAPYAYTPFCNDRPEVEGFRFWNHGYWKSHLNGRPYHISALYVVDLKRFRRVAAGDRLRGQYQGLSQDPNSLANLDQDLPNNMIHQVQIKSLPKEWLWCETWCSDATKSKAKTIDMCNNPQTKEPKLERAIRIAPEWTEYDNLIRNLLSNKDVESLSKNKEEL